MKNFLLLLLLFSSSFLASASGKTGSLYNKLYEVNKYWQQHPDAVPAGLLPVSDEREMIKMHLQLAEKHLRQTNVQHLSEKQKQARITNLNSLRDYWQSGDFPINTTHSYRLPIFIDPFDNFCAVGYLIKASGNEELSRHISRNTNFAYLADMSYPELTNWTNNSGLSLEELAWIQPGYPPSIATTAMGAGTNGTVNAMTMDANGNIYAAGSFTEADGNPGAMNVAMWLPGIAGYTWVAMGPGLHGPVTDLEMFNGELYASGSDLLPTGASHSIAKWDGTNWVPVYPFGGFANALQEYNGDLYVAGYYVTNQSYYGMLAKWNGSSWTDLNIPVSGVIHTLAVHDNKLIIGGEFTSPAAPYTSNIMAYDGTSVSTFGVGLPAKVRALTTYNNQLYAGGDYMSAASDTFGLARWNGSSWTNLVTSTFMTIGPATPQSETFVSSLIPNGTNSLIVGGSFYVNNMTYGINLATFQEYQPNVWGFAGFAVLDQSVYSLLHDTQLNRLYMGGAFTENLSSPLPSVGYMSMSPNGASKEITKQNLTVYPNPVNSQTCIKADAEGNGALTFEVYNLLGQKVQQWQENKAADGIYALTKAQLGSGTYLLNVHQAGKAVGSQKLLIE